MQGYISDLKTFRKTSVEKIIDALGREYPDHSSSEERAWKQLIRDVKNSEKIKDLADDVVIAFEYSLPTDAMAIDLLLSGYDKNGNMIAFIIESKQWDDEYIFHLKFSAYRESDTVLHPQVQICKHETSFSEYLDIGPEFHLHPLVFIRNCTDAGMEHIKNNNPRPDMNTPVYNNMEEILKQISSEIVKGGHEIKDKLENAVFNVSKSIIESMSSLVSQNEAFVLTPEQENIFYNVLKAIKNGKKIIRIFGCAGSGKTAILLNLYLYFLKQNDKSIKPIFISGAQNTALYRSIYHEIFESFAYSLNLDKMMKDSNVKYYVLMDEAQHNRSGIIENASKKAAVMVLCYDYRQIISANNPYNELKSLEQSESFAAFELTDSMRYNGSKVAELNIRNYLQGKKKDIVPDNKFEFKEFTDFQDFQNAIIERMKNDKKSTVAVTGLMSNDADKYTDKQNKNSVLFTNWGYKSECEWIPYVEEQKYLEKSGEKVWVGTWWLPGLDVDYIYVIVGGDAKLTNNGIVCNINETKQYSMIVDLAEKMKLPRDLIVYNTKNNKRDVDKFHSSKNIINYLDQPQHAQIKKKFVNKMSELTRNMYYILLTRGRKGCCVYFTNREE